MKGIKYLLIALAIAAALATAGWLLRNSLIERISSPLLADYDVTLVDVSLDALATSAASIGYLELVHAKGTRIVIEDLELPIGASGSGTRTYAAQRVSIVTSTRDDDAPFDVARLMSQFLSLLDNFAGNEVHIAEFNLAPYPSIRDLRWSLSRTEQRLDGTVESIQISTFTRRVDAANYDVRLSVSNAQRSGSEMDTILGKLQLTDDTISIAGHSTLQLPRWQAIAKLAAVLPATIELVSGAGELEYELDVPFDVSQSTAVRATLTPSSSWHISYAAEVGNSTDVLLQESSSIEIDATFPQVEWSVRQADATLLVTSDEWRDIPLSVRGLSCQSGPACSVGADVSWSDAATPIGNATHIEFASLLNVSFPAEGVRVDMEPNASIELSEFSSGDSAMGRVAAKLVSAATMQYASDGWDFSAASVDATIESLALDDNIAITSAMFLENVTGRERDGVVSASTGIVAPSLQAEIGSRTATLPSINGEISFQDADIAFDLTTVGLSRNGTIKGQHNVDNRAGEVAIGSTELALSGNPVSARVSPWNFDFDMSAGKLAADLNATWVAGDSGVSLDAKSSIKVEDLAGFYTDTAFAGLSTDIEVGYSDSGLTVHPTRVTVGLIDMGIPIENLAASVDLNVEDRAIGVDNLEMTAFGGRITATPFSFHTGRPTNNIVLQAKAIELAQILAVKEFAAINVTGTIGAVLPITLEQDGVSIDGGRLTGEPPGGVIRYGTDDQSNDPGASSVALVTAALSNFEYESLTSDVTYSKDGDLDLQMQLKGRNPDLDDGRPVVLNLGVENNVPQMLKSLQAARTVEEILENRLAN